MASIDQPSLLSLPQELRDHIYAYLFLSATATTEHPFPECMPSGPRWGCYTEICLVNKALHNDAKAYFIKHIAPRVTFYFDSFEDLRVTQREAPTHPILRHMNFHIRCGTGTFNIDDPAWKATCGRRMAPRLTDGVEALIRVQPGFEWWMDELPGFYRSKPATLTNYGYFPATGSKAWKPREWGVAVCEQMGGDVCDSPTCLQRARGNGNMVEVTEVHYPPLIQTKSGERSNTLDSAAQPPSGRGSLRLSCLIWPPYDRHPGWQDHLENSIMVLEGKLMDVWLPSNPVDLYLKQRKERMR